MWADYRLSEHQHGVKRFFHEAVGDMRLNWQTLHLPDSWTANPATTTNPHEHHRLTRTASLVHKPLSLLRNWMPYSGPSFTSQVICASPENRHSLTAAAACRLA